MSNEQFAITVERVAIQKSIAECATFQLQQGQRISEVTRMILEVAKKFGIKGRELADIFHDVREIECKRPLIVEGETK